MTYPFSPLPVVVEFWDGNQWVDITLYVYSRNGNGISIRRGFPEYGSSPEPSSCTFELNNRDGRFSPRNPTGPYYGLIGRNTPVRVSVTGYGVRYVGEISEWPSRWDVAGVDYWVDVTAQGVLRRLGQGGSPIRSPLRAASLGLSSGNDPPRYYWSFEDGEDAQTVGSGVGGSPIPITDLEHVAFAGDGFIVGSLPLVVVDNFNNGSTMGQTGTQDTVVPLSGIGSAGFTASFAVRCTLVQTTHVRLFSFSMSGATGLTQAVIQAYASTTASVLNSNFGVAVTLLNGEALVGFAGYDSTTGSPLAYPNLFDGEPHSIVATAEQDGADIDLTLVIDGITFNATVTTVTLGEPVSMNLPAARALFAAGGGTDTGDNRGSSTTLGHLAIGTNPTVDLHDALDGYDGELAADRAERLCAERGVAFVLVGNASDTVPMGPQETPSTWVDAFNETWQADHALVYESRDELGLTFRTRVSRYNVAPTAVLDYAGSGEIAPELTPTDDDQHVRNDVTVRRKNGSSARAIDATSRLGTADPPHGAGVVDEDLELNVVDDSDLLLHASFRVLVGTLDEPRYPVVTVDMAAVAAAGKTSVMEDVAALDVADGLQLINLPVQAGASGGVAELAALGFAETLVHPIGWRIEHVGPPSGSYRVQQLAATPPADDLLDGWLIPDWFALRVAIDDNDTSLAIDIFPRMTTDADDFAARLVLGGEELSVTACATTAATYVAVGAADHDDNAVVTPGDYASGAVNDWVVVVAGSRDTSSPTLAITDANYTYTQLGHKGGLYVWAAVRTASTPAPTVTPTGGAAGDTVSAQVFGLRGMPVTQTLTDCILASTSQANSSAQNIAFGSVPAGEYAGRVVLVFGRKSDDWTSAAISGFTEITETSSTSGSDQALYAAYRIDTTATAVSAGSITATGGASAVSDSLVIALQGGYQTLTATRSVNGVVKSHAASTDIELLDPIVASL